MQKSVAIIDDDQDDLEIMEHVIRTIDPTILCTSFIYPEEAINTFLNDDPSKLPGFVFIDINMPGFRGDKCLEVLRSNDSFEDVKIIMYSTSMPDNIAEELKNSGADYVFEKPVRIKAYSEIITQILREP
jgi:CheY-like chemotaxis protein